MDILDQMRIEIDKIDSEMTLLFERRMNVVKKLAKYKKDNNLPIYNKNREEEVIKKNTSNLINKDYESILNKYYINLMHLSKIIQDKEIVDEKVTKNIKCRSKEKNLKVGFQGVIGSFSEEAMHKYFDDIREVKNYEKFEDVFKAIDDNEIEYGILPIENSSTGGISNVYDLLNKYKFYIVGEECIKINQNLIGIKGTSIKEIREVYSHPQGFEQSGDFLKEYRHLNLIPHLNTAISAKFISDLNDTTKAAIASKRAAEIYNLEIIEAEINDIRDNYTKFIIVGKDIECCERCNKTSIVFSVEDESGSLYELLRHFSENNINMMKIESRPNKNIPWRYLFYVDFEGSIEDENIKDALNLMERSSKYFKFLGCYEKVESI